jgi:hypothetical protein
MDESLYTSWDHGCVSDAYADVYGYFRACVPLRCGTILLPCILSHLVFYAGPTVALAECTSELFDGVTGTKTPAPGSATITTDMLSREPRPRQSSNIPSAIDLRSLVVVSRPVALMS